MKKGKISIDNVNLESLAITRIIKFYQRYLAVTQFEESNARTAFPCYDEPEYKTEFTLTVHHGSTYNAISNTAGTKVDK